RGPRRGGDRPPRRDGHPDRRAGPGHPAGARSRLRDPRGRAHGRGRHRHGAALSRPGPPGPASPGHPGEAGPPHNGGVNEPIPVIRAVDHGTARLLPDVDRERAWLLTVDDAPQSYVDLNAPEHLEFEYARRLGHVVDCAAAPGAPLDVLHLGGGGLTLPRYVAATRPGSRQEVVDADRGLLDLVAEHLPLPERGGITVHAADARARLEETVPG